MSCFCCVEGTFETLLCKMNQESYRNCLLEVFHTECELWLEKIQKMQWIQFRSRNKVRQFFEARWRITVERDIFILIETLIVTNICFIRWYKTADKDDIDNLMNDSDTKFIAEEEITQAVRTKDTSLTTS